MYSHDIILIVGFLAGLLPLALQRVMNITVGPGEGFVEERSDP